MDITNINMKLSRVAVRTRLTQLLLGWRLTCSNPCYIARYISCIPPQSALPLQGWKGHVSISSDSFGTIFQNLIPELARFEIAFKIAASIDDAAAINSGLAGRTQVGKVLVLYPQDEQWQCVRKIIGEIADFPRGPKVPDELQSKEYPNLYLRFGAISPDLFLVDQLGRRGAVLNGPDGQCVIDFRGAPSPDWAPPPPLHLISPSKSLAEKIYASTGILQLARLTSNEANDVAIAIDTVCGEVGILKSRKNTLKEFAMNEVKFCKTLMDAGYRFAPRVIRTASIPEDNLTLALFSDVGSSNLLTLLPSRRVGALRRLIDAVLDLSLLGFSHNDIKPSNVIIGKNDEIFLVDFEHGTHFGEKQKFGSPFYSNIDDFSREVSKGRDHFSLLMTIISTVLGTDLSRFQSSLQIVLEVLTAIFGSESTKIITKEIQLAQTCEQINPTNLNKFLDAIEFKETDIVYSEYSDQISGVVNSAWQNVPTFVNVHNGYAYWKYSTGWLPTESGGINSGIAGTLLSLAVSNNPIARSLLNPTVESLLNCPVSKNSGLFTGNAGAAVALAAAFRVSRDPRHLVRAHQLLKISVENFPEHADLFSGRAGIIYAGVLISELTESQVPLEVVSEIVRSIKDEFDPSSGWESAEKLEPACFPQIGLAHGAVGIAFALSRYDDSIGELTSEVIIAKTFGLVTRYTDDERFPLDFSQNSKRVKSNMWCHGAMGILWALLQLDCERLQLNDFRDSLFRVFEKEDILADFSMCHGMAGQIEVCRMALAIENYAPIARLRLQRLIRLLVLFKTSPSWSLWVSDTFNACSPDLWTGFMGTLIQLELTDSKNTKSVLCY